VVLDFSDLLILGMALPNLIVVYMLRGRIKSEMENYIRKYQLSCYSCPLWGRSSAG
jgi:Na+/alanine symporter